MREPTDLDKRQYDLAEKIWGLFRQLLIKRGIDLSGLFLQWTQAQKDKFQNPGTRGDFDELCDHGCVSQALAGLVFLTKHSPRLLSRWSDFVGPPSSRSKTSRTLEDAAQTLEQLFGRLIAVEDDEDRETFREFEMIPPSALVSSLRHYSTLINYAEILKSEAETRSPVEFARFLLTNYVERATGRPHDRNVATLLAEAQGFEAYDEVAQRMWRDRHYKRLNKHHSKIAGFLFAISVGISRQT